jgi:hypothetical protein
MLGQPRPNLFNLVVRGTDGQTHLMLTLATVVVGVLVIFVTAFLVGFWCGWMWRRWRR